jgi:hypothetical protein
MLSKISAPKRDVRNGTQKNTFQRKDKNLQFPIITVTEANKGSQPSLVSQTEEKRNARTTLQGNLLRPRNTRQT